MTYILCPEDYVEDGAVHTVTGEDNSEILLIFDEESDAERYSLYLLDCNEPPYKIVEIEKDILIDLCEAQGYIYSIVTKDHLVLPIDS
jgi:hypothetical protein